MDTTTGPVNFDQITEDSLILPQHRHLLNIDFEHLGSGPSSHQLVWISDMESALSASMLFRQGSLTHEAVLHFSASDHHPQL